MASANWKIVKQTRDLDYLSYCKNVSKGDLANATLLRQGSSRSVYLLGEKEKYIAKYWFRIKKGRQLKSMFKASKALEEYELTQKVFDMGRSVYQPLAYCESRKLGILKQSCLFIPYVKSDFNYCCQLLPYLNLFALTLASR